MEYLKKDEVYKFINRLPELDTYPPQVHLLMLAVRSKKGKAIFKMKMSDIVVERDIVRPSMRYDWKERYFNKVYNLAMLQHYGLYTVKGDNVTIAAIPEVLAIYATVSPRHVFKSVKELMTDNIQYLYETNESGNLRLMKQHVRFFSALHKHKVRDTNFVTLDIDVLDENLLNEIRGRVEDKIPIFMITETSGGYHIVLDISESEHARLFYGEEKLMQKLGLEYESRGLEIQRDSQEPVPGTKYFRNDGSLHYVKILK